MKHVARSLIGLALALLVFWPYLYWWDHSGMAQTLFWMWIPFLAGAVVFYGAGWAVTKMLEKNHGA